MDGGLITLIRQAPHQTVQRPPFQTLGWIHSWWQIRSGRAATANSGVDWFGMAAKFNETPGEFEKKTSIYVPVLKIIQNGLNRKKWRFWKMMFPFQTGDVQVPCSFSLVFQSGGEKSTCKQNPTEILAPQGNKNKLTVMCSNWTIDSLRSKDGLTCFFKKNNDMFFGSGAYLT